MSIEAMKQALEASKDECVQYALERTQAILDQAIAEAEKQKPVDYEKLAALGWQAVECGICGTTAMGYPPPKREWVGLTDEERSSIRGDYLGYDAQAKAIEKTLKEKNT